MIQLFICEFLKSDYFENLSISIIGAFIGIGGALYIYNRTLEKNREEEKRIYNEGLDRRLKFTVHLLDSVLDEVEKQASKYTEQAKNITGNPYEFHFVELLASNRLDRLLAVDSQELFNAFIMRFGDTDETINRYKEFLRNIDFTAKSLDGMFDSNDKNVFSVGEDQEKLRIAINKLYDNYRKTIEDGATHPAIKDILAEKWSLFQDFIGTGKVDLQALNNDFLVPLFNEVLEESQEIGVNSDHVLSAIRDSTTLLDHIRGNNLNYAEDASGLESRLTKSLNTLRDISKELKG